MSTEDNSVIQFHQQNLCNHMNILTIPNDNTFASLKRYREVLQSVPIVLIINTDEERHRLLHVLDDINMKLRNMYAETHDATLYYWTCEYKYLSTELYNTIRLYHINDINYIKYIDNLVYTCFHTDDMFPIEDHIHYETHKEQLRRNS